MPNLGEMPPLYEERSLWNPVHVFGAPLLDQQTNRRILYSLTRISTKNRPTNNYCLACMNLNIKNRGHQNIVLHRVKFDLPFGPVPLVMAPWSGLAGVGGSRKGPWSSRGRDAGGMAGHGRGIAGHGRAWPGTWGSGKSMWGQSTAACEYDIRMVKLKPSDVFCCGTWVKWPTLIAFLNVRHYRLGVSSGWYPNGPRWRLLLLFFCIGYHEHQPTC